MAIEMETESRVNHAEQLRNKFRNHTATVAVAGAGYVGLPLAVEKAKVGFPVVCLDRNATRVNQINQGENYIRDVRDEEFKQVVADAKLRATTDFAELSGADVVIICVPTPLTVHKEPDLQYVRNVTGEIAKHMHPGILVSLESTTYPGTTEEVILPALAETGLKVGHDFFLVHSPERVDPGNARYTTKNTNKLVGGVTEACTDVGAAFYGETIIKVIRCSSPAIAEMAKVFENTYRAVNIALVNEMALLCDQMGLNVWEMLDAAFTKPFGIQPFYPGPGVGGHCIPIDPFYLAWKAREFDFPTRFIELAGEINLRMPHYVVGKAERILGTTGKSLRGARILVLGAAYKRDLPDCRESPSIKVMELLLGEGAIVEYHDPLVPQVEIQKLRYGRLLGVVGLESVELNHESLKRPDLVIVATDHSGVDYSCIVSNARAVLDTRNVIQSPASGSGAIWHL